MRYYSGFSPKETIPNEILFPNAVPFWLKHKSNELKKTIVICVHGHGATTYESRPIAEQIFNEGLDVVGMVLPAHGIKDINQAQKAMGKVKMEDWLNAIRKEIRKAREIYDHVFIYGQSMGGAISLVMASENLVEACAVTSPAIILPKIAGIITFLFGWLNINIRVDLENEEIFNEVYAFRNMKDTKQLVKLANYTRKNLFKIKCPTLVCHSHNDILIDPSAPELIQKKAKGSITINWYDKSSHCMPLDVSGKQIGSDIAEFFKKHLEQI
ncbi:alpha/beta hydrolase [Promethearchaeum syntrophicum]|uniref:Alpha/beta hydrolase n=1 Tax=Promethearchaeum syntrophicum TaxID=2594042 RepID=A0A5B9D962_9ARCH|nr:alpha/beta fold hydrolase [Candidatus Prometheoarchaeum syntrophicum]QEE15818.1 Alpha/beta hydrolase family protein [Candidatus Prometheoarchaeum syntrophicum]